MTRWRALLLLAAAGLAGMSVWFGASAAAPALADQWGFAAADAGRLTLAVQLGFVAGTLASAIANVSDVFPARHVFAVSALLAALGFAPQNHRQATANARPLGHSLGPLASRAQLAAEPTEADELEALRIF